MVFCFCLPNCFFHWLWEATLLAWSSAKAQVAGTRMLQLCHIAAGLHLSVLDGAFLDLLSKTMSNKNPLTSLAQSLCTSSRRTSCTSRPQTKCTATARGVAPQCCPPPKIIVCSEGSKKSSGSPNFAAVAPPMEVGSNPF